MENIMVGFDKEAAEYILNSLREDGAELDYALMEQTLPLAMEGELAYLEKEGMLKDGELLEGEYDEDAAFEIMIEHVSRALPQAPIWSKRGCSSGIEFKRACHGAKIQRDVI